MRSRILIADDHPVVLEGLRRILDRPEFEIVDMVRDGRALVAAAHKLKPDAIVADISMPLLSGVEAARQIRKHDPNAKIIFLTMHREKIYAVEAIIAGGSGYVLKTAVGEELVSAIREVMNGRIYVTRSLAEPVMKALRARRESSDRGAPPGVMGSRSKKGGSGGFAPFVTIASPGSPLRSRRLAMKWFPPHPGYR